MTSIQGVNIYGGPVLVTGACSFIAPYVIEELARKGYDVRATDLPGANFCDVEGLPCDSLRHVAGRRDRRAYNASDDSTMPAGELIAVVLDSLGIASRRILPFPDLLVSLAARVGSHLPGIFFTRLTNYIQRRRGRVAIEHALIPMLKPRFDPGFTAFRRGDYDFENASSRRWATSSGAATSRPAGTNRSGGSRSSAGSHRARRPRAGDKPAVPSLTVFNIRWSVELTE